MPPGVICAIFINDGDVLLSRVMPNPKLTAASGFINATSNNSPYAHHKKLSLLEMIRDPEPPLRLLLLPGQYKTINTAAIS